VNEFKKEIKADTKKGVEGRCERVQEGNKGRYKGVECARLL
jgi:hypothetical protein